MRVTAGKYKNRRILCPPGIIRPAMERMRISLFSILGDMGGKSFLDMFSGSGVMSAEAASRGAVSLWAVERDFRKKEILRSNLSFVEEEKRIFIMDAFAFLRKFAGRRKFDIIWFDPPFAFVRKTDLLGCALNGSLLNDGGIMAIHYPKEDDEEFSTLSFSASAQRVLFCGRSVVRIIWQG